MNENSDYISGWVEGDTLQVNIFSVKSDEPQVKSQFKNIDYPNQDIRNLSFRNIKENYALMLKAYPRMQIYREMLINSEQILEAFIEDNKSVLTSSELDFFKELLMLITDFNFQSNPHLFMRNQKHLSKYKTLREILFYFDRTNVFAVEGTIENRLAINENGLVLINLKKISELDSFTPIDALFNLLHEFGHQISDQDVSFKDTSLVKLLDWSKTKFISFKLNAYETYWCINLGKSLSWEELTNSTRANYKPINYNGNVFSNLQHADFLIQAIKRKFFFYRETFRSFTQKDFAISSLINTQDFIGNLKSISNYYGAELIWPQFTITSVRYNSVGDLVIDYNLSRNLYFLNENYRPTAFNIFDTNISEEINRTDSYKLTIQKNEQDYEILANHSFESVNDNFSLKLIKQIKNKKYISLLLKLNSVNLKELTHLLLIARSSVDNSPYALKPLSVRVLNQNEVLLHFEMPTVSLNLRHIVLPREEIVKNKYTEVIIRPEREIQIKSATNQNSIQKQTNISVNLNAEFLKKNSLKITNLNRKKIKTITIDIEYSVHPTKSNRYSSSFTDSSMSYEYLMRGYGPVISYELVPAINFRKKTWLNYTTNSATFMIDLPEENFTFDEKDYSQYINVFSPFQNFIRNSRTRTNRVPLLRRKIDDLGKRSIKKLIFYFDDGTFETKTFDSLEYQTVAGQLRQKREYDRESQQVQSILNSAITSEIINDKSIQNSCKSLFN